jgi:hypothetical protein
VFAHLWSVDPDRHLEESRERLDLYSNLNLEGRSVMLALAMAS